MNPPEQLDMFEGNRQRDIGIQKSINHEDYKEPSWSDRAVECVRKYPHKKFMTEDVRVWSYANGLPKASSGRAWGSVITKAQKSGIIIFHGYDRVKNPNAHRTPAAVWVKL